MQHARNTVYFFMFLLAYSPHHILAVKEPKNCSQLAKEAFFSPTVFAAVLGISAIGVQYYFNNDPIAKETNYINAMNAVTTQQAINATNSLQLRDKYAEIINQFDREINNIENDIEKEKLVKQREQYQKQFDLENVRATIAHGSYVIIQKKQEIYLLESEIKKLKEAPTNKEDTITKESIQKSVTQKEQEIVKLLTAYSN